MPTTIHPTVEAFLNDVARLASLPKVRGQRFKMWEDRPALLLGCEYAGHRVGIHLSTVRRHYRVADFEPYENALSDYNRDVGRTLQKAIEEKQLVEMGVGTSVATQPHQGSPATHFGKITALNAQTVTVRHHKDCCEKGRISEVQREEFVKYWRIVAVAPKTIVRKTAWERLGDIGEDE